MLSCVLIGIFLVHELLLPQKTDAFALVPVKTQGERCIYRDVTLRRNVPMAFEWPCEQVTCKLKLGLVKIRGCPPPPNAKERWPNRFYKWPGCCYKEEFKEVQDYDESY
uniref:8.9 kDa family member n=1 Tax=Rhipicephalus appendiculatus TaxID=34631 RepID=A0A131Z2Q0_RHIAP